MIKDFKHYYHYLLILIGLGMVSWIIWARFIRTRVPKDIPFNLTEYWFFILAYICLIYFYVAYKLIRPGKPNEAVTLIVELLFTPLVTLDESLKHHPNIQPIYHKFVDKVITRIQSYQKEFKQHAVIKRVYIRFYILPRVILVSILCLDTFYFHKLAWIYKIILLGALPLLHRYLKYSLKYIKEEYIKKIEYKYKKIELSDINELKDGWVHDPEIMPYHNKSVSVREYIQIELDIREYNLMYNDDEDIGYKADAYAQDDVILQFLRNKYNSEDPKYLTSLDIDYLLEDFEKDMPIIFDLSKFLDAYGNLDTFYLISKSIPILIKHIKILIFSLYGICWAYIIYKSYPMIPYPFLETLCELVITLSGLEEPFSGELIIYI